MDLSVSVGFDAGAAVVTVSPAPPGGFPADVWPDVVALVERVAQRRFSGAPKQPVPAGGASVLVCDFTADTLTARGE